MENSLNTEGKKKKASNLWLYQNCKHTFLCPAIHSADLVTKFSKIPFWKKKAFTAQGTRGGGWEEGEWDKPRSSSASPRKGETEGKGEQPQMSSLHSTSDHTHSEWIFHN